MASSVATEGGGGSFAHVAELPPYAIMNWATAPTASTAPGPILKPAGEHGLAAPHLRPHGRKRGQGGSSEPPPYPDHVLAAGLRGHAIILGPDRVSSRHRNPVVVRGRGIHFGGDAARPMARS